MFLMALTLMASDIPPQPMRAQVVRDRITDEVTAYAIAREDGNTLVVSCRAAERPRVSFHSRLWLARGNPLSGLRAVTYRFDDQAPRRMMWDIEDRRGMLESRRRVAFFLQGLANARQVVIRARDIEDRPFDMVFHLQNAGPAVEQALTACGTNA